MARGRAASWLGRQGGKASRRTLGDSFMPIAMTGIVGAGIYGGASAIMDEDGPWGDIQEQAMGDRGAIKASMKAGISNIFNNPEEDILGRGDYYYGQATSTGRGGPLPVSGDIVFGQYNLRR